MTPPTNTPPPPDYTKMCQHIWELERYFHHQNDRIKELELSAKFWMDEANKREIER